MPLPQTQLARFTRSRRSSGIPESFRNCGTAPVLVHGLWWFFISVGACWSAETGLVRPPAGRWKSEGRLLAQPGGLTSHDALYCSRYGLDHFDLV